MLTPIQHHSRSPDGERDRVEGVRFGVKSGTRSSHTNNKGHDKATVNAIVACTGPDMIVLRCSTYSSGLTSCQGNRTILYSSVSGTFELGLFALAESEHRDVETRVAAPSASHRMRGSMVGSCAQIIRTRKRVDASAVGLEYVQPPREPLSGHSFRAPR